jgi:soluble lytic murein transglycosylase
VSGSLQIRSNQPRLRLLLAGGVLGLVLWTCAAAQVVDLERVRAEFLSAYADASSGINIAADADSPQLREYAIYPYLEAARIERQLLDATDANSAADTVAAAFLEKFEGTPIAFGLHRRWLDSLARRSDWQTFRTSFSNAVATAEQQCQYLRARIETGDTRGLVEQIEERWLTPAQLPLECEPVFQWMRDQGSLDDELTEQRVRLLLQNGQAAFARVIARRLPRERAEPLLLWARLLESPITEFDRLIATRRSDLPQAVLISAWEGFTRANPAAALELFDLFVQTQELGSREASAAARALALGLAWDRRAREAIAMFARISASDLDDYALGWLARAALWAGDWQTVEAAIASMSAPVRNETAWRYWLARTLSQQGDAAGAEALFEAIVPTDNFYAVMAAAHLGERFVPHDDSLPYDAERAARIAADETFSRARELFATGLRTEATREWRYGLESLGDERDKAQSVHVAARWGWYDVAVATATEQGIFNDYRLLYPLPYKEEISAAAAATRVGRPLLYGLMRQESLFRDDVVSASGAIGLAQVLPETARRAAAIRQWPEPDRADLFDAAVNIRLGAATLGTFLDRFDSQLPVALAAYNAGPNAAERWLPTRPVDADIWLENIPYNETRAYVRRVLWHALVFAWRENGIAQDTRSWIARVTPLSVD